jgi:rhodanese-related sulfurtransferase
MLRLEELLKLDPPARKIVREIHTILQRAQQARKRIQPILPHHARRLIASGSVILLDVRSEEEFQTEHLAGAIRIGYDDLKNWTKQSTLTPFDTIVCYCAYGYRSVLAADTLQRLGYRKATAIEGGIRAYLARTDERKAA